MCKKQTINYMKITFCLQAYIIHKIPPAKKNLAYVQIRMGLFTGTPFL